MSTITITPEGKLRVEAEIPLGGMDGVGNVGRFVKEIHAAQSRYELERAEEAMRGLDLTSADLAEGGRFHDIRDIVDFANEHGLCPSGIVGVLSERLELAGAVR